MRTSYQAHTGLYYGHDGERVLLAPRATMFHSGGHCYTRRGRRALKMTESGTNHAPVRPGSGTCRSGALRSVATRPIRYCHLGHSPSLTSRAGSSKSGSHEEAIPRKGGDSRPEGKIVPAKQERPLFRGVPCLYLPLRGDHHGHTRKNPNGSTEHHDQPWRQEETAHGSCEPDHPNKLIGPPD